MASRKKDRKAEREARQAREAELTAVKSRENMVKWVTIGFVAVVFVALIGFLIYNGKAQDNTEGEVAPITFEETPRTIEARVATGSSMLEGEATESAEVAEVVEVVEFADFQCPTCQAYHPTVKALIEQNPNVRFVFKHFPLSGHQHARRAAMAAEAAGEQGKFFEMVDLLFENQSTWAQQANPTETFLGYARELELDINKFTDDLDNEALEERVQNNLSEGIEAGVGGTPTFFFNGKKYPGLPQNSVEAFEVIIQSELENE